MVKAEQMTELVARLDTMVRRVTEAEGRDCSDSELARRFLSFSGSTVSRMRSGTYGGNLDRIADKLDTAEDDLDARLETLHAKAEADQVFIRTRLACAAIASVNRARDDRSHPVVVMLAPTGAGKSKIGEYLEQRGAVLVEGRQSWRCSYKAFCADVAAAAGHPIKSRKFCERDAETQMLSSLRSKDGVLYIDEANTLGASTANAIKLIVNQTGYAVVVAAIPEMWDGFLAGAENEVRQVVNRCQPVLRFNGLTDSDVKPFLSGCGLPAGDMKAAVQHVRKAANEFGAIKTVMVVAVAMKDLGSPTLDDLEKELGCQRKNVLEAGIKENVA